MLAAVPDAVLNGDPTDRLPGNAHFSFPGCEGDALLLLLDARGIACSTGSACSAGVAQPSHVLVAMGADEAGAAARCGSRSATPRPGRTCAPCWTRLPPVVERARRAGLAGAGRTGGPVKVLAAMSGGVDSAVAAARAVDAGHDVTGVHLALARNPQTYRSGARGCCTLEDARDARRAADVIGIPFYVWDMADEFHADVVDDFVAEYAAGRTPNPCLRCNEKIKFAAVLDRALALGFDAVVTGHHARLGPDGLLRRSVDAAKDQSYVLAVLTRDQLAHAIFPLGDIDQGAGAGRGRPRAGWPSPTSRTRTTSASSPTATPAASCAGRLGDRPGPIVDALTGEVVGRHDGAYAFTVGQRRGLRPGPAGARRRPAVRAVDHAGRRTRSRSARPSAARRGRGDRRPSGVDRRGTAGGRRRVRGPAARARRRSPPAR